MIKNKLRDIKRILFGAYGYKFTSHPQAIAPALLVVRGIIKNSNGEYLFVRRSENDRHDSGQWEFPGGKIDRGEFEPLNALKDEISQETGLQIEITDSLRPYITTKRISAERSTPYNEFIMLTVFYKCLPQNTDVIISDEHDDYMWLDIKNGLSDKNIFTHSTIEIIQSGYLKSF